MDAIVVYESLWGNTAEVARAVAEGLGPGARALRTDEVRPEDVTGAELVVAGAPVLGFKLSSERMRDGIRQNPGKGPAPDLSCPLLRAWLAGLDPGSGWGQRSTRRCAARSARALPRSRGCWRRPALRSLAEPEGFVVRGKHGPLRDGELERARAWGEELASEAERRRSA